jgi:DNA-binding response OmpR family regulator
MASIKKILFTEDEPALAEIVKETLVYKGFDVYHSSSAKETIIAYQKIQPDIIVLDVMLPDGDGFSIAKHIRKYDTCTPIIFLTSKSFPSDVVTGFESGGNDYLKKPFSMEELAIRIQALLSTNRLVRMSEAGSKNIVSVGKYVFKYPEGVLTLGKQTQLLTGREAEILHMLVINQGKLVERNLILNNIWDSNDYFSSRSLDVFITKLRNYLREDPSILLMTIRGKGYQLLHTSGS